MYRVKFYPRLTAHSGSAYSEEFETFNQAQQCLNTIANYTLFLHESILMNNYSNSGYIEELDGEEWVDVDLD